MFPHASETHYTPLVYQSGSVNIHDCSFIATNESSVNVRSLSTFTISDSSFINTTGSNGGALQAIGNGKCEITRCCAYGTSSTSENPAFLVRGASDLFVELVTIARIPTTNVGVCTNAFFRINSCIITLLNVSHVICPQMAHGAGTLFGASENGHATLKKSIFQHLSCGYGLLWIQNWGNDGSTGQHAVEDCILANCQVTTTTRSLVIGYGVSCHLTRTIFRDNEYPVLFERAAGSHTISHCWTERAIACIGGDVDVQGNNKIGRGPTKQPHYYTNTLCVAPTYVFSQQPIRRLRVIIPLSLFLVILR